jgi:hypothetical protein
MPFDPTTAELDEPPAFDAESAEPIDAPLPEKKKKPFNPNEAEPIEVQEFEREDGSKFIYEIPQLRAAPKKGVLTKVRESLSPLLGETKDQLYSRQAKVDALKRDLPELAEHIEKNFVPPEQSLGAVGVVPALFHGDESIPWAIRQPGEEFSKAHPVAAGVGGVLAEAWNSTTASPGGLMTAGLGTVPKLAKVVGALFTADMGRNVIEQAPDVYEAVTSDDVSAKDKAAAITGISLMGLATVAPTVIKRYQSHRLDLEASVKRAAEAGEFSRQQAALEAQRLEMERLQNEPFIMKDAAESAAVFEQAFAEGQSPAAGEAIRARLAAEAAVPPTAAQSAEPFQQQIDVMQSPEGRAGLRVQLAQQAAEAEAAARRNQMVREGTGADLQDAMRAGQLAGPEAPLPAENLQEQAARQIRELDAQRATAEPNVDYTTAAQRARSKYALGAAQLLPPGEILRSGLGALGGFGVGYYKGRDLPDDERTNLALQWSFAGGMLAGPLRERVGNAILKTKIPVGKMGLSKHFAGAENFYVFQRNALKGVGDALKGQGAEIEATAFRAVRAYDQLEKHMKSATYGDKLMANKFLAGTGSAGNIANTALKDAAQAVRNHIDDFTLELKARGLVAPGSDMDAALTNNLGSYLTRAYKLFKEPFYKPEARHLHDFINEYAANELQNRSTKTISELKQEGSETALRLLAKGPGGALDNAANFALGGEIARADGSILKPRKKLTEATRRLLGEFDDPVNAAGQTIDRMTHFLGAAKTQQKMAEVGLATKMFSTKGDPNIYSVPLKQAHDYVGKGGPLANLWTTPEIRDALRSDAAYKQSGLAWRTLATITAASKLTKTAGNIVSYAPNLISSAMSLIGQGGGLSVVRSPGKTAGNALRLIFDDVLPTKNPEILAAKEFLLREGIMNQSVNLQDLRQHLAQGAPVGKLMLSTMPENVAAVAKKLGRGVLKTYGALEELPRLMGFFTEVERYKAIFPNATKAEIYRRAADVTRKVFPNAAETPDIVKKLSVSGIASPFVSYQYDTAFRNPYNTARIAMADISEGMKTGNKRLIAAGANRMSWYTGAVLGAIAINEALKDKSGVSDKQEEAIKRIVPDYDRDGLLAINELNEKELSYANQSYLIPHAIPAAAIKAATEGVSPLDAAGHFAKEFIASFKGDGGVFLGPLMEAIQGRNEFGRQIFTQDAGRYVDPAVFKSKAVQDLALKTQQSAERASYVAGKAFTPGTINEINKWHKAVTNQVGPDGQLYDKGDLTKRLFGYRLNRLDLPTQFKRQAADFGGRLREIGSEFKRVLNRKDSRTEDVDRAYGLQEQARKRVLGEIKTYLDDAVELKQNRTDSIANLADAGVSSELILGAINGYYVPGDKDQEPSLGEKFDALMKLPEGKRDAEWALLMERDEQTARDMIPLFKARERGLSDEEKLFLRMSTKDGRRARNVATFILNLPNEQARSAAYERLLETQVINQEVDGQLTDGDGAVWAQARAALKSGKSR